MPFEIPVDMEKDAPELAVGEGFPKTGFIGGWTAKLCWKVGWFETDLDQAESDVAADLGSAIEDFLPQLRGTDRGLYDSKIASRDESRHLYYYDYRERERAQALIQAMDREEPLDFKRTERLCWFLSAPLDGIMSLNDEAKAKFNSDPLTFDVEIMTLRSKKNRHPWHMMVLPSFIAAYATAQGIENPGFDLSILTRPDDQVIFNDDLQKSLIGNADIGYTDGTLWKQRAALWEALGEADPEKSHTLESDTKLSTGSAQLNALLQPTVRPWVKPVFCRLIPMPDPRVDAAYGEGDNRHRPSIPIITEFYDDGAAAFAAVEAERGQQDGSSDATSGDTFSTDTGLAVPDAWKTSPDGWVEQVADIKGKLVNYPPPLWENEIAMLLDKGSSKYIGFPLGATKEELITWLAEI